MTQLERTDLHAAIELRYPDNITEDITPLRLRDGLHELVDSVFVTATDTGAVPNVPLYKAGTTYVKGFTVRWTLATREAFYAAQFAGKLPAPIGPGDLNWKEVAPPTAATALWQSITRTQAQGIEGAGVQAGRLYQIDMGLNLAGKQQYVYLDGLDQFFDITRGVLEVDSVRAAIKNIDLGAGTWQLDTGTGTGTTVSPRHDAYTAPTAGAQSVGLVAATFVWQVGKRSGNGALELLSYGSGWTFANNEIQLLSAAGVPANGVIEVIHNGTGLAIVPVTPGLPVWVGWDGNSLFANDVTPPNPADISGTDIPAVVAGLLGPGYVTNNFAVSGQTTTQMLADVATQLDPFATDPAYAQHALLVNELRNAITVGGQAFQPAYDELVAYLRGRQAAGFKPLITTLLPSTSFLGNLTAPQFEDLRQRANHLYRNNWRSYASNLVDLASVESSLIRPDGTHPDAASRALEAPLFRDRLLEVLTGTVPAALAPAQVRNLTSLAGNGQVLVSWDEPDTDGSPVTDYQVQSRTGSNAFQSIPHPTSSTPMLTVTGLTNGSAYDFRVACVTAAGVGAYSAVLSATPTPATYQTPVHYAHFGGNNARLLMPATPAAQSFCFKIRTTPGLVVATNPALAFHVTSGGLPTNSAYNAVGTANGVNLNQTDATQLGTNDWVLVYVQGVASQTPFTLLAFTSDYGGNYYALEADLAEVTVFNRLWTAQEQAASAYGLIPTTGRIEQFDFTTVNNRDVVGNVAGLIATLAGPLPAIV